MSRNLYPPLSFEASEVELRLSNRLVNILSIIKSGPHRGFGLIAWKPAFDTFTDDWSEAERTEGARSLKSFLEPKEPRL